MNPIAEYEQAVQAARSGRAVGIDRLDRILEAVGRSHRDFIAAVWKAGRPSRAEPGDHCTHCATGVLRIYCSRRIGGLVEQRLRCNRCGGSKCKRIIPGHFVQRRCSNVEKPA